MKKEIVYSYITSNINFLCGRNIYKKVDSSRVLESLAVLTMYLLLVPKDNLKILFVSYVDHKSMELSKEIVWHQHKSFRYGRRQMIPLKETKLSSLTGGF